MNSNIYSETDSNGNQISPHAFVGPNVIMGKNNVIMEGVIIRDGVEIGDNNFIGPYCVIGEAPEKRGFYEITGKVKIGSNNRFTGKVTIDSGTERLTQIGDNVTFLKNVHIGHDSVIADDVTMAVNVAVAGWVVVAKGTNMGLGVSVHQRLYIPQDCMIGMNAVITKGTQMQPGHKYAGVPAKEIGINKR